MSSSSAATTPATSPDSSLVDEKLSSGVAALTLCPNLSVDEDIAVEKAKVRCGLSAALTCWFFDYKTKAVQMGAALPGMHVPVRLHASRIANAKAIATRYNLARWRGNVAAQAREPES